MNSIGIEIRFTDSSDFSSIYLLCKFMSKNKHVLM